MFVRCIKQDLKNKYIILLFTDTKYFSFNNKRKNLAKVVMRKSQLLLFLESWHYGGIFLINYICSRKRKEGRPQGGGGGQIENQPITKGKGQKELY